MKAKTIIIVGYVLVFVLGFTLGTTFRKDDKKIDVAELTNIVNEIDTAQIEEEKIEFELNKYKLLDNTNYNIPKSFKYEEYKKVIDSIYNYEPTITSDDIDVNYYTNIAIMNNMFVDYLVDNTVASKDGKTVTIEYAYETKEEHEQKLKEIEDIIKKVLVSATANDLNEFEKVLFIYTYWSINIQYDSNADGIPSISDVIFNHKGTSQNYTKMINYTLGQLGIESYSVAGDTIFGQPHEWNLVKIYDNYYQLDATYESTTTDGKGLIYFGRTKQEMLDEGRVYSEWEDGFIYEDFSDLESNKLRILKNAVTYKLENHELTLYDTENKEYAKINTQTLDKQ